MLSRLPRSPNSAHIRRLASTWRLQIHAMAHENKCTHDHVERHLKTHHQLLAELDEVGRNPTYADIALELYQLCQPWHDLRVIRKTPPEVTADLLRRQQILVEQLAGVSIRPVRWVISFSAAILVFASVLFVSSFWGELAEITHSREGFGYNSRRLLERIFHGLERTSLEQRIGAFAVLVVAFGSWLMLRPGRN